MKKRSLIIIAPLVLISALSFFEFLDLSVINENHFDIITVNSIFAGFLFSSLSLIFGLGKDKSIILLERMDSMDKIYLNITSGIVSSLLSIVCALINIFTKNACAFVNIFEAYLLILTILYFAFSVNHVELIIGMLRQEIKKELPNKEIIQHAIDKMK